MQNQKISTIPPLIENNETITDPTKKADSLNSHFASKAKVQGNNDNIPFLDNNKQYFFWTFKYEHFPNRNFKDNQNPKKV